MPYPLFGKEALNKEFLIVLIRWLLCLVASSPDYSIGNNIVHRTT